MSEPESQYPWDDDHPESRRLTRLIELGVEVDEIVTALGSDAQGMGRYRPFQGRSLRWVEQRISALEARAAETAERKATRERATQGLATDRQISYILDLLARRRRNGDGGGFMIGPTDRAGIAAMTRQDASAYINSLTEDY